MKVSGRGVLKLALAASIFASTAVRGAEIKAYMYDTLGRLVQVDRSGSVNNGARAAYTYDSADNRSNVTVTVSTPSLTISDASTVEGGVLSFTVSRGGPTTTSVSVNFASSNGTATAGSDYNAASGTLTFAIGETTKTISIQTIDDAAVESAETVNVTLSGATGGAVISDALGVGTITDNDAAAGPCSGVSYTINDVTVLEGSPLVFTVTKTGATTSSCSVNYATANGTATTPTHYTAASGTLTFTSAQTSRTVSVTTIDNARLNATLKMYLNLSSATSGAVISDSQGIGSIQAGGGGCLTCRPSGDQSDPNAGAVTEPPPPDGN